VFGFSRTGARSAFRSSAHDDRREGGKAVVRHGDRRQVQLTLQRGELGSERDAQLRIEAGKRFAE
jgi:hypothetical protein